MTRVVHPWINDSYWHTKRYVADLIMIINGQINGQYPSSTLEPTQATPSARRGSDLTGARRAAPNFKRIGNIRIREDKETKHLPFSHHGDAEHSSHGGGLLGAFVFRRSSKTWFNNVSGVVIHEQVPSDSNQNHIGRSTNNTKINATPKQRARELRHDSKKGNRLKGEKAI
jgi:hypothetical protein